jgi:NAD(P)-dependent dehydrogenase (short-subunit alcohol dehydrogenase family)
MVERGYGRIVNISSATFWIGYPELVAYIASKGGLVGFTRGLAVEAGAHGIAVNCITPGFIATEGSSAEDPTGETELRPYGPNGELICYFCAMSPEHRAEATRQLNARLDAAESASLADGGTVAHILLTPDGPKPLKTGRS